jgi:hypothetical protein
MKKGKDNTERIPCESSGSKALPALWEEGGGKRNTGRAQIICNSEGLPKKSHFIKKSGTRANGQHAFLYIEKGDVIIRAERSQGDIQIKISEITGFDMEGEPYLANLRLLSEYSHGEWTNLHATLRLGRAIGAAKDKISCYHCRMPHYVDVVDISALCSYNVAHKTNEKEATHVA